MIPPILERSRSRPRKTFHQPQQVAVYQFYLLELKLFGRGGEGKFGISHFILIDSLNFVFEPLRRLPDLHRIARQS